MSIQIHEVRIKCRVAPVLSITVQQSGGSGSSAWGSITGTLANQLDLQAALDAKQAIDGDLTTIAGLTPSDDDFLQRKSGAWANRTLAQVRQDIFFHSYRTGVEYSNNTTSENASTQSLAANNLRAYRLRIHRTVSFDRIGIEVTTLAGSTSARIGIYTDNGSDYPDALVSGTDYSSGYDTTSTGDKNSGALSFTLTPGTYWIAINSNGGPLLRSWVDYSFESIGVISGSGAQPLCWAVVNTYGAMPSTFPAGAAMGSSMSPVFRLRVA